MNAGDRRAVALYRCNLEDLKAQVEAIGTELRVLADAEREKFDNLPAGLDSSDAGAAMEAAADALDEAAGAAEDGDIQSALSALDDLN